MRNLAFPLALDLAATVEVRRLEDALSTCRSKAWWALSRVACGSGRGRLDQPGRSRWVFLPMAWYDVRWIGRRGISSRISPALGILRKPWMRASARFVACVHQAPAATPAPRVHAGMVWRPLIRSTARGAIP